MDRDQAIGTLVLRDPASNERLAQIAVYSLSQPSPIKASVPAGRYAARYVARNGTYTFPPESTEPIVLTVGRVPAEIHVDVSTLGALELVVLKQDSTPYGGPWSFGLQHKEGSDFVRSGNPVSFAEGPYLLEGVPEGTYACQFGSHSSVVPGTGREAFSIHPGQTTVHVVRLDR